MSPLSVDWLIILTIGFLSHVLLLVNSGRYWDSWIVSAWQIRGDNQSMGRFYREVGMPVWYYIHRFMGRLPGLLYWYNAITFISLLITPVLVFEICRRTGFLTQDQSLIVACLAAALPLPLMVVDYIIGIHYVCPLTLFYTAWLLVLPTVPTHYSLIIQVLACVLFFMSFNKNSLLMFFGWFYIINFLVQYRLDGALTLSYFVQYGIHTVHFLLLPVLFWVVKTKWTPTGGAYASYNKPALPSPLQLAKKIWSIYTTSLYQATADAFGYVFRNFIPSLFVFGGTALFFLFNPWRQNELIQQSSHNLELAGVGLLGLAFAGIPYILVGQSFGNQGWVTKNNTLLPVPAACVFTSMIGGFIQPIWAPFFSCLLLGVFIWYWNYSYLRWFAVTAKYNAILSKLDQIPNIYTYSVLGLWDQHFITGGSDEHPEHGHGCSTVSHMLAFLTKGKPFCVCFPDVNKTILTVNQGLYSQQTIADMVRLSTIDYAFKGLDHRKSQALVIIESPAKRYSCEKLALRFLRYRLFRPSKLPAFYRKLLTLEFIPLPENETKPISIRLDA